MDILKQINAIRKEKKITQKELAFGVGVSRRSMNLYLNGGIRIPYDVGYRCLVYMGYDLLLVRK